MKLKRIVQAALSIAMTDTEKWVKDYIKKDRHGSWGSFRHAVARRLGIIKPPDPKHPLRWESPSRQWSVPEEYLEAYKKYRG